MTDNQIYEISNTYGTPLYILDTNTLLDRISYLKSRLPKGTEICYAIKANSFIPEIIQEFVDKYEVCSPGELQICRDLHLPEEKLVISGVYKTPSLMDETIKQKSCACFTVESVQQFELLRSIAEKYNTGITIMPRLTSGSQFGIEESEIISIIKNRNDYPLLTFRGIQFFSGTQKISVKKIKRELEYLDLFLSKLFEETGYETPELEYGGGFPVIYFEGEVFDENEYLSCFSELYSLMNRKTKLTLELGRSIVASCGVYATKVVDMKTNKNENYAITDGGINHLVYYGQSMAMRHPFFSLLPEREGGVKEPWNICGALCTVNDILVKQLPLDSLKCGDVLAFKNSGAYCMSEGISLFLSRALPKVIMIDKNGKTHILRQFVETYKINEPEKERID